MWHVASPQDLKFEHGRVAKLVAQLKGSANTCFCAGEFIAGAQLSLTQLSLSNSSQLLGAVAHLHAHDVIHRDIKVRQKPSLSLC